MLFSTLFTAVLAGTAVSASDLSERANKNVEGPFALKIKAAHKTYANKYVTGTHVGAGIDQAIPGDAPDKNFYINATDGGTVTKTGPVGLLEYNIVPGIPFQGSLLFNISSNLAPLWLAVTEPEYTYSFDSTGKLLLSGLSRWFGCTTYTAYGPMAGINWKLGTEISSEPDCQPIELYKA